MEGEEMLEMGSAVGTHVAVVVAAVVLLYRKVALEVGAARPLTEEEKQRRLHLHFRHLPQKSSPESR